MSLRRTMETLKSKHPDGPENPFGDALGPLQGYAPTSDGIKAAINSFRVDTSPGISVWTVPLLRHAAKSPRVSQFFTTLTSTIGAATDPGPAMLSVSCLTPLLKSDAVIRPIIVGELIYRLATKVLLKKAIQPDLCLPYQFGVGSPGDVEPVVRSAERALDGTLDQAHTHVTSLDSSNAFNTGKAGYRGDIAKGLRQFALSLCRTVRWAYGTSSASMVAPSQGVRQVTPSGPSSFPLPSDSSSPISPPILAPTGGSSL